MEKKPPSLLEGEDDIEKQAPATLCKVHKISPRGFKEATIWAFVGYLPDLTENATANGSPLEQGLQGKNLGRRGGFLVANTEYNRNRQCYLDTVHLCGTYTCMSCKYCNPFAQILPIQHTYSQHHGTLQGSPVSDLLSPSGFRDMSFLVHHQASTISG